MTELFFEVVIAIFNAVTSFLTADYFYSLFATRNNKHRALTAAAFALFIAAPLVLKMTIGNMIILAICMFVVSLNFDFKLYNKLLFSVLFVVINCLVEVATVLVISMMSDNSSQNAMSGFYLAVGALLCKFFCIMVCFVIGIIKKEVLAGKFSLRWISLYTLPVATYIVTFSIYRSSFYYEGDAFLRTVSLSGLVLLIISNLLIIKLVNDIRETAVNEQRLKTAEELVKQQEKQYDDLFRSGREVYKIQHDNKNFLLGLLSETESGNLDGTKELLKKKIDSFNAASARTLTGNSAVDTVLNYKLSQAREKGIKVDFDHKNLVSLCIPAVDFSILFGNAFDNAVEASEKLEKEQRYIKAFIIVKDGRLIINVSNNVAQNVDVTNLKSIKEDVEKHGFGIINMQSLAEKLGGEVVFDCRDKVFATMIMVDNRSV